MELERVDNWTPEKIQMKWSEVKKEGVKREVIQVDHHSFLVAPSLSSGISERSDRNVNLLDMTCSCGEYQQEYFPCLHAAACICRSGADPKMFMDKKYHLHVLKQAFNNFVSVVDVGTIVPDGETVLQTVTVKRGRPKSIRIRSRGENQSNRGKCSSCGEHGHNISTCQRRAILRKKRLAKLAELRKKRQQEQEQATMQRIVEVKNNSDCNVLQEVAECDSLLAGADVISSVVTPLDATQPAQKGKRIQKCSVCKQAGHNKSSCATARAQAARQVVEVSVDTD